MYSALTSAYVAYWYQYGAMLPPYSEGMTWKDLKKEPVSASYTLRPGDRGLALEGRHTPVMPQAS